MSPDQYLNALLVILMSTFKFLLAPFLAVQMEFRFFESLGLTVVGGMVGVFVFSTFSNQILGLKRRLFPTPPSDGLYKPKLRKYLVFWQRWGMTGTAFLSPVLISIPIGVFLAVRFGTPPRVIYWRMFLGILFWGIALGTIGQFIPKFSLTGWW